MSRFVLDAMILTAIAFVVAVIIPIMIGWLWGKS
jgi:hypothetical protein